jgi:hypothetical protein
MNFSTRTKHENEFNLYVTRCKSSYKSQNVLEMELKKRTPVSKKNRFPFEDQRPETMVLY